MGPLSLDGDGLHPRPNHARIGDARVGAPQFLRLSGLLALTGRWLILADDLTGAADAGIAFARRGRSALVAWGGAPFDVDVLALDADSRHQPASVAGTLHVSLLNAHRRAGTRLFKKMDSTLRGQPAAEIAAVLDALRQREHRPMAVVAPAFPPTGRTTLGGRIHLHGTPLEDSPLWGSEHAYPDADLRAVMRCAGLSAHLLGLDTIRGDAEGGLRTAMAAGVDAVICDATEPSDLDALARAGSFLGERLLWVGSGGLAAALAATVPAVVSPAAMAPPTRGGTLIVVGSVAAASHEAAKRIEEAGTATWDVAPRWLNEGDPRLAALGQDVAARLAAGDDVLVRIGVDRHVAGAALAPALARALDPALGQMGALFATGGETARALLEQGGVRALRLVDEVEPGVPLALSEGTLRVPVVTKAGAFGDAGTIGRSLDRLRKFRREHGA